MTLATLVRLARRRLLGNELLSQGANASSAALAALILLLLLGTQILSWQWAVTIPLAALAAGFYLVRRRLPSPYSVAQMVSLGEVFCDPAQRAEFQQFFTEHKVPASERTLQLTLERIEGCIDLRSQQESRLQAWLQRQPH